MGEKENEGILPRFCRALLGIAQEKLESDPTLSIKVAMSFVEIYNEKVFFSLVAVCNLFIWYALPIGPRPP